jgi:hypothetical protein
MRLVTRDPRGLLMFKNLGPVRVCSYRYPGEEDIRFAAGFSRYVRDGRTFRRGVCVIVRGRSINLWRPL